MSGAGARKRNPERSEGFQTTTHQSPLAKYFLDFVEQAARFRFVLHGGLGLQLLQQLALAFAELARRLHADAHIKVALPRALQPRQALAANTEGGAGLR